MTLKQIKDKIVDKQMINNGHTQILEI